MVPYVESKPLVHRVARWPVLLVLVVTLWASTSGLGWRHLWVDEVDTAERASAVLAWGYPRVVDRHGVLSLNTGGYELEDGETHRFSPWGQFYVTAAGLAVGRALGWSGDFSARLPAALAHTAAAGGVTWGCLALAGATPAAAAVVGLLTGLDSVRLTYARQARHHAMVEALVVLGLVGLGLLRLGRKAGLGLASAVMALTAHLHPLSGAVFAVTLLMLLLAMRQAAVLFPAFGASVRDIAFKVLLPGAASALVLLLLARPWRQDPWAFAAGMASHALAHQPTWWGLAFVTLCVGVAARARAWRVAGVLLVLALTPVVLVQPLALTTVSSYRYFLFLPLVFALWPVALGPLVQDHHRRWLWAGVILTLLGPDLHRGLKMGTHAGVALALQDARQEALGTRQPLHQVVDFLRQRARPDEPILWDMVPQYVNWYLPGQPVALLPDLAARVKSTQDSPWWKAVPRQAVWHVWFPKAGAGTWDCSGHCDVRAVDANPDQPQTPYTLESGRLGTRVRMCPVMGVPASRIANAPFLLLATGALQPAGAADEMLVVSHACDAEPP
jgi:hypothetical protein